MAMYDRRPTTNTSKRLPIVFCLDVSPSMGWKVGNNSPSIDLLNAAVRNFVTEIQQDTKARTSAEIAFVTFSTNIEMDTEFASVSTLQTPVFRPVAEGGTQMAQAVLRSIQKIENRRRQLEDMEIPYYAPFLVLVTDGNPDENDHPALQAQALAAVKSHCDSHVGASEIIVPFVIGVGDHTSSQTLNNYAAGFTRGYFPIRGTAGNASMQFNQVFKMIGNSTKKSIHLNGKSRTSEVINTIQNDMDDLWRDLNGE